jgi:hypothetical protein
MLEHGIRFLDNCAVIPFSETILVWSVRLRGVVLYPMLFVELDEAFVYKLSFSVSTRVFDMSLGDVLCFGFKHFKRLVDLVF